MNCEYVRQAYGVPAEIGRRVIVGGKPGIIAKDRGHYIGVNFDCDKPGVVKNAHPTSDVLYGDIGVVRKPSKWRLRYERYLEYGDGFESFLAYCRWDAAKDRPWNA